LPATQPVHVAVGVIVNTTNQVLISRRHPESHQGGLWEFPGGKVEEGESLLQALDREFQEELGIRVHQAYPLLRCPYNYADKSVLLDVWEITAYDGAAAGLEGQEVAWRLVTELDGRQFPAANAPIIDCLKLPREIAITPNLENRKQFLSCIEQLLAQDVPAIQVRQKHLDARQYGEWFRLANQLIGNTDVLLFSNTDAVTALTLGAEAIHLDSQQLLSMNSRPVPAEIVLSASTHNAAELQRAEEIGVNMVTLSPVAQTAKYSSEQILGWHMFAQLRSKVMLPVLALGGLRRDQLAQARAHGAFGIAGIKGFAGNFEG